MKRNFGFIVAVSLLASVLAGAILFHSPIGRAMWPSRPADLSTNTVPKPAVSEPSALADTANADRLDIMKPLPVPHSATARVGEIEEPIEPTTSPTENFGQPTGLATAAGKEFAFDLYARLATSPEGVGKNIFFSPYSVSSVLIMAAEGARGETAEEMGKALHFPKSLHRDGLDAADNPWDLMALHKDMAAVNQSLNAMPEPQRQELRARLADLRKQLKDIESPPPPPSAKDVADTDRLDGLVSQDPPPYAQVAQSQKLAAQINDLIPLVEPYELNLADALWVEKSYPLRKTYLDVITRFYQTGGAFACDFRNDSDGARRRINAWGEKQTKRRIAELIPPDGVDVATALILTDAVYFRGSWLKPFEEFATRDADFSAARERVRVRMMHQDAMSWGRYAAFNADGSLFSTPKTIPESKIPKSDDLSDPSLYPGKGGFFVFEMPYKGERLSMAVILPHDVNGLADLEKNLTAIRFDASMADLVTRDVNVFFPKFRLDANYKMIPVLKTMGMSRAFMNPTTLRGAQFDGMCASGDTGHRVYITDVLHKASVEVSEKGTEAVALSSGETGLALDVDAQEPQVPFVPTFRADRPFVFAIRDPKTGTILFLGRVVDPRG